MMEAAPAAPLIVSKAQFLFQLLIIALDPPAPRGLDPGVGQVDQAIEGHVRRDGGKGHPGKRGACRGGGCPANTWRFRPRPRAIRLAAIPGPAARPATRRD